MRYYVGLLLMSLLVSYGVSEPDVQQLLAKAEQAEKAGELTLAHALYHHAAALKPNAFGLQYKGALMDLLLENWSEAEAHLAKVIALRPGFALAHLNLGVVLVQKGEKEKSRQAFLTALRLDTRLTKGYHNLGLLELDAGRLDAAEELFKKALRTDPTYPASYKELGSLYVKQGRFAAALSVLKHALSLHANDAQSFFYLGVAYEGLQKYASSRRAFSAVP